MGHHQSSKTIRLAILMAWGMILTFLIPFGVRADMGYPAPNWDVKEWINTKPLFLPRMRGKVVVLEFFQMDCRTCDEFSIPMLKRWYREFSEEIKQNRLIFVSIHSVPELALYQTEPRLRRFIEARGIRRAVGVDRNKYGREIPETMYRYNVKEIPVMVFIDKRGDVRYQKTGRFSAVEAESYLRELLAE